MEASSVRKPPSVDRSRDLSSQLFSPSWRKDPNLSMEVIDLNRSRTKDAALLDNYHSMIRGWDFIRVVGKSVISYSRQTNVPEKKNFLPVYRKTMEFYEKMFKIQEQIDNTISQQKSIRIKMQYFPNVVKITQLAHLDAMTRHGKFIEESFEAYEKLVGLLNGAGWCTPQMDYFGVQDHMDLAERKTVENRRLRLEKLAEDEKLIPFPMGRN